MVKYQLVFIKIEAALARVLNAQRLRTLRRKATALQAFARWTRAGRAGEQARAQEVLGAVKMKVEGLVEAVQASHFAGRSWAFGRWRRAVVCERQVREQQERTKRRKAENELRTRKLQKELEAENERMVQ